MNQQESNYIPFTSNQELANPMDLFLNEEWLRKSIQAEEEVGGNVDRNRLGNYCFSCGGFVETANYKSGFG